MTPPVFKMEFLQIIPEFSGEVEQLSRFISLAEKLTSKFYNTSDPDDFQNELLIGSLIGKIKGDAQKQISNFTITKWEDLKTALVTTYSDRRDIFTLTIELTHMKQGMTENSFDFFNRITNNLNIQTAYIATQVTAVHRATTQEFAQNLALRVLLRGLKEPLGPLLRTRNPKNLGEALNMMTNDFQMESPKIAPRNNNYNQNQTNGNRNIVPFGHTQRPQTFGKTYVPPMLRNYNYQQQRPQQNWVPNRTNTQRNLGNNRLPTPTPMDTSTMMSRRSNQPLPSNSGRFNPRPNQNYYNRPYTGPQMEEINNIEEPNTYPEFEDLIPQEDFEENFHNTDPEEIEENQFFLKTASEEN